MCVCGMHMCVLTFNMYVCMCVFTYIPGSSFLFFQRSICIQRGCSLLAVIYNREINAETQINIPHTYTIIINLFQSTAGSRPCVFPSTDFSVPITRMQLIVE